MRQALRNFFKKIGTFAIEIYLISFIILNILDFVGGLPGEIEFFKKILSWIIVIHLIQSISMTEIFFGSKHRVSDMLLILTFSILSLQSFVYYIRESVSVAEHHKGFIESQLLLDMFEGISQNYQVIIDWSWYIGFTLLIILSIFFALKFDFFKRSVLGVLHEEGPPSRRIIKDLVRILLTFIVLNAFSLFIFNLLLEWFGWAVDAPLLIIGLTYWVYLNIRHFLLTGRLFRFYAFLEHVGNFGERFLERFISLFHYKETFYIGLSGLLVLHCITDVFTFLIPYITGLKHTFYMSILNLENHTSIFFSQDSHFSIDSASLISIKDIIVVFIGYILNIIAMLLFMLLPAYLWYRLHHHKAIVFNKGIIVLFFISLTFHMLSPSFFIEPIDPLDSKGIGHTMEIMGVDIKTASILSFSQNLVNYLSISILVGFVILILLKVNIIKKIMDRSVIIISMLFFGRYTLYYFLSIYRFTMEIIRILFEMDYSIYMVIIIFIHLFLTFIIYIAGYLVFFYLILIKKKSISYETGNV